MPDPVYNELLEAANELIGQFGKPGKIIRKTLSGPGYAPIETREEFDVVYVETGYSLTNRDATLVDQGDVMGLISMDNEAGVLDKSDIFEDEFGIEHQFVDTMPLNPGGVQLLTEFHCRK